jgi:UDP-N-acetylglucosamine transferase subunit ALG13
MILVSCGTNETPFDRLVRAAGALADLDRVVLQRGSSQLEPPGVESIDYLSFDDLRALIFDARVFVTHAGVGSVILSLGCQKTPVVLPRRAMLHEAVDDHQLVFAERLAAKGMIRIAHDTATLRRLVGDEQAAAAGLLQAGSPGPLHAELDRVLDLHGATTPAALL